MEENFRRYPIGIQNFEDLRNNDCVYVDKTELIYRLTHTNKVYFLSRPRRFGKSLLVQPLLTANCFYGRKFINGKKEKRLSVYVLKELFVVLTNRRVNRWWY